MLFYITLVSALSIIIPAIAGLIRLRWIRPDFYPFIIILLACFFNEAVAAWMIINNGNNAALYNIFSLVYVLLMLWQFYAWWPKFRNGLLLSIAGMLLIIIWLTEWRLQGSADVYFHYFVIVRCLIIVAWSVFFMAFRSRVLTPNLQRDPVFLIVFGWGSLFLFNLVIELLLIAGDYYSSPNANWLQLIFAFNNLFVILIHLYAILCMPPRIRSLQ